MTATEDLMREHGVLRRALIVYSAAATKLRDKSSAVPPEALHNTAKLFRTFGENYHERMLEEDHIFPKLANLKGQASRYVGVLIYQHERGREITGYILASTQGSKIGATKAESLARVMESFVWMYHAHAGIEDTVVFPAWKSTLSSAQLMEMTDSFEDIEHQQFGEDGFEMALRQISEIEATLGLADLAQFTAPPPPK
ncbi:MAG: hemerythrin domain-containing protein [Pseudomonadota bacterium]|nr:hemerythrin domain-containing protein [Pseudomonadota bacterium]